MKIPMPNFLKFPIYAFELSDKSYKYLRLKEARGGTILDDFGEGEIAAGVIEHGEIKKKDILTALLKELFSKKNIHFAAISLPEEKGFLENIQLSGVKEGEMRQALELQLEEHVPLPPSEVIFDYVLARNEKDHSDVVLNAFPRSLVEDYLEVFSATGVLPTFVESELAAAVRSIVPQDFISLAMIMDWGKTRTSFFIVENRVLRFASTIPIGGETLDRAIAKNLNVRLEEAQKLKAKKGFLQDQDSLPVFQAIVPAVTAIREEAEKYLNFWQTHSENKEAPKKLFLSGGDANLLGLPQYLEQELGLPVVIADPWANVKFPKHYLPNLELKDAIRFSISIGLALAAMDKEKTI